MKRKNVLRVLFYITFLGSLTIGAILLNLPAEQQPPQLIEDHVFLQINYGNGTVENYTVNITINATVFSVLCAVANVSYEYYSYGVFVTAINGVKGDWVYYVNGEMPGMAADRFYLRGGEKIEWKCL